MRSRSPRLLYALLTLGLGPTACDGGGAEGSDGVTTIVTDQDGLVTDDDPTPALPRAIPTGPPPGYQHVNQELRRDAADAVERAWSAPVTAQLPSELPSNEGPRTGDVPNSGS